MSLEELPPPGAPLAQDEELLYRNVRPQFVQGDRPSTQVFEPAPCDKQLLSVDRSGASTAREAFERFLKAKGATSAGILAVSVAECRLYEVPALDNTLEDNVAHCVADFRKHGRSQTKKRAGMLRDKAVARGWQYQTGG